jgi:hypothetical protein
MFYQLKPFVASLYNQILFINLLISDNYIYRLTTIIFTGQRQLQYMNNHQFVTSFFSVFMIYYLFLSNIPNRNSPFALQGTINLKKVSRYPFFTSLSVPFPLAYG